MVMEVVTESLDMRNNIGHALGSEMAGEEDYNPISVRS